MSKWNHAPNYQFLQCKQKKRKAYDEITDNKEIIASWKKLYWLFFFLVEKKVKFDPCHITQDSSIFRIWLIYILFYLQQQGGALQASGPLLSQVAPFNPRTSNVTIFNAINTTTALPSSGSAFTSTVSTNQVPLQNVMFTALTEKPIAPTVAKPSPTKAGKIYSYL